MLPMANSIAMNVSTRTDRRASDYSAIMNV
jgi:hypothetical protein